MQRETAKKSVIKIVMGAAILLFCGIAAQRASAIPQPAAAQTGNAGEGQKLFEQKCATCHGPDGSGNTPVGKAVGAKDLRSSEALKMSDTEIFTQIDKGKGNMPPFGDSLDKAKINDLIGYVRELGKKQASTTSKKSN